MTTIHCEIDRAEGSLIRLLGLIERRGFAIDAMSMGDDEGSPARALTIAVRGIDDQRRPEVLERQIDRLSGVRRLASNARGPR